MFVTYQPLYQPLSPPLLRTAQASAGACVRTAAIDDIQCSCKCIGNRIELNPTSKTSTAVGHDLAPLRIVCICSPHATTVECWEVAFRCCCRRLASFLAFAERGRDDDEDFGRIRG